MVDAISNATKSSHTTHTATWNVKNFNSVAVPNGSYKLRVELTDKHAQGPLYSLDFNIGDSTGSINPADKNYFHNIELSWLSTVTSVESGIDIGYELLQNYPNPFNPTTTIGYSIPQRSFVQLKIYDILGNEMSSLINEEMPKGSYKIKFNASFLKSGIYFYRLQTENYKKTKKLILLR